MKLELVLNTENADEEISILNDYIGEQNLDGIMTKIVECEHKQGEMSVGDYMPIIQFVLGAPVVVAGVKGIFDIIKNYFELQKEKIVQSKITFNIETTPDGKKESIEFSSFDEEERKRFFKIVDKTFRK